MYRLTCVQIAKSKKYATLSAAKQDLLNWVNSLGVVVSDLGKECVFDCTQSHLQRFSSGIVLAHVLNALGSAVSESELAVCLNRCC